MFRMFDRTYNKIVLGWLAALVWFGALARGGHDLWAATIFFFSITLGVLILLVGRWRAQAPFRFPLAGPAGLFLLAMMLSRWHSFDIPSTRLEIWGWWFSVLAFYLYVNACEGIEESVLFMTAAGAVVIPLCFIALWQQVTGHPDSWGYWEICATLNNSIVFAGFVLYWLFFWGRRAAQNDRWVVFFLAAVVSLVLARSWWAYVSLAAGAIYLLRTTLLQAAGRHKGIFLVVAGAGVAVLAVVVIHKLRIHRGPYLGVSRWFYWRAGLGMWKENPWTGVGLGGYATAFPFFKVGNVQNSLFPHSAIIQMLAETGLVGVMAAAGLGVSFIRSARHVRSGNARDPWASVCEATLVTVVCFSLLSINMEYLLNKFMIGILAGSALVAPPVRVYSVKRLWIATAAVGLILLIPWWLSPLQASRLYVAGVLCEGQKDYPTAEKLFHDALSLDPSQSESYVALSHIKWESWKSGKSREAKALAEYYLKKAIYWRKDIHYLAALKEYRD
jgi:hypothetical protein